MWESNGNSSKLLKICILDKAMFSRCKPCAVQKFKQEIWWNVGILTFPTCLSLVLNSSVGDPLGVRTACLDILKHVQVPGQIDGLTAERPGSGHPLTALVTRHMQNKPRGNVAGGHVRCTPTRKVVIDSSDSAPQVHAMITSQSITASRGTVALH